MVEELYISFYNELLCYCMSLSHDRALAEDLVSETFMRALSHLMDIQDLSMSQRRSWLYKTAKHLYIDRMRKLAWETCVEDEQLDISTFEQDLTGSAVRQLVGRLPESERALFIMKYYQGYNSTELGELFSLSPSTVRSRLASARRRLKSMYKDEL